MRRILRSIPVLAVVVAGCGGDTETSAPSAWEPIAPSALTQRATWTGVVSLGTDEAIVVGYSYIDWRNPSYTTRSQRYVRGSGWTAIEVPGHRDESFRLLDATKSATGTVWACGGTARRLDDPAAVRPVVYRWDGTWTEVDLGALGAQEGMELSAIAVAPNGEVRAAGSSAASRGVVLQRAGDAWTAMSLPEPAGATPAGWSLTAVGCGPDGIWYAAGSLVDHPGGALFVDRGQGWQAIAGPGARVLHFTDLGFEPDGTVWLAANHDLGDDIQGVLYRFLNGQFAAGEVDRRSGGGYQVHALDFDASGNGWAVGGRFGDQPFFARLEGGRWAEVLGSGRVRRDADVRMGQTTVPPGGLDEQTGGELIAVAVLDRDAAFAAGQAEEVGEGGQELELVSRFYQLGPAAPASSPTQP